MEKDARTHQCEHAAADDDDDGDDDDNGDDDNGDDEDGVDKDAHNHQYEHQFPPLTMMMNQSNQIKRLFHTQSIINQMKRLNHQSIINH